MRVLLAIKRNPNGLMEHLREALLDRRRALHDLSRVDLLRPLLRLLRVDGLALELGPQLLQRVLVVAQVRLRPDQQQRRVRAVVPHLRRPLRPDVLERRGVHHAVAHEEHVRLGVAQRAQAVVVLLAGSVVQPEVDGLPVDYKVGAVVVEHRGRVLRRERPRGEGDEKARLPDGTVSYNNAFKRLHGLKKKYVYIILLFLCVKNYIYIWGFLLRVLLYV